MPDSTSIPIPGYMPVHRRPIASGPIGLGTTARAESSGPRWRDIQWVDFTSDPDSGTPPAPPRHETTPRADRTIRKAATLDGVLRHFARRLEPRSATAADVIPGLAARFTRVPVARLAPVPGSPTRPAGSRATPMPPSAVPPAPVVASPVPIVEPSVAPQRSAVVMHPRLPEPAPELPPLVPTAEAAAPPVTPNAPDERPFPASISTSVSLEIASERSADRRTRLGEMFADWRGRLAGSARSAAAGAANLRGVALSLGGRVRAADWRIPAFRFKRAATVAGFAAARENRLRLSGLVALSAIVVALVAYGGGALLASVTGPKPSHQAGVATSKATTPPAAADKNLPQPAMVSPLTSPPSGPPTDPAARAAFYTARAKAGDPAAQYDVAVLYARGDGLVQDYASAFSWFHAAATQGNVAAQYNLAVMYAEGLGVPAQPSEALNWYRSAADQNHPAAQFNLALFYAQGSGTKQDYATASRWYERAARQGLAPAMINLAILYEQGNGVERSLIEAYAWYSAAAERGDADAKHRARELFQQFSDKDQARAQGLAATIGAALDPATPKS
jgi:hypothetical protein